MASPHVPGVLGFHPIAANILSSQKGPDADDDDDESINSCLHTVHAAIDELDAQGDR